MIIRQTAYNLLALLLSHHRYNKDAKGPNQPSDRVHMPSSLPHDDGEHSLGDVSFVKIK